MDVSHFTDEDVEDEESRRPGFYQPYTLELTWRDKMNPGLEALPLGRSMGIQVTQEKWPQAILKATCTYYLLLVLRASHFSSLPTTHSQISG